MFTPEWKWKWFLPITFFVFTPITFVWCSIAFHLLIFETAFDGIFWFCVYAVFMYGYLVFFEEDREMNRNEL